MAGHVKAAGRAAFELYQLRLFARRASENCDQPTHARALRKRRIHGESSPQFSGCQLMAAVRKTRSGCGIMIVTRPAVVVRAVMPKGELLGLSGYCSVGR